MPYYYAGEQKYVLTNGHFCILDEPMTELMKDFIAFGNAQTSEDGSNQKDGQSEDSGMQVPHVMWDADIFDGSGAGIYPGSGDWAKIGEDQHPS